MISRLYRLVARLSRAVCRHPEGIVCPHRHYEYDLWLTGFHAGHAHGVRQERNHREGAATRPAEDAEERS